MLECAPFLCVWATLLWWMARGPPLVVRRVLALLLWWMVHGPPPVVCRALASLFWVMAHCPQVVVCRVCCACRLLTKRRLCPRFAGLGSGIL